MVRPRDTSNSGSRKTRASIGDRASTYLECLDGLHGLLAYALDLVLGFPLDFCRVLHIFGGGSRFVACFPLCGGFSSQGTFPGISWHDGWVGSWHIMA